MLEIRPICENCEVALAPNSTRAMICSFECTFCEDCALHTLGNVCPNCGGGFSHRPIRPSRDIVNGNSLLAYPGRQDGPRKKVDIKVHNKLRASVGHINPEDR